VKNRIRASAVDDAFNFFMVERVPDIGGPCNQEQGLRIAN
jgi:hypothetical protein